MYLWNTDSPYPDGDMEAGIVIHELSHGLSTRLTGGPKNSGCLGWGEAGGMGEGWGGSFKHAVFYCKQLTLCRLYCYLSPFHLDIFGLPDGCLGCQPPGWYP